MTLYKILSNTDDGGPRWQELGEASAASHGAAVRAFINGDKNKILPEDSDGVYIAVPARSWQPVTVKVERTVKIGP